MPSISNDAVALIGWAFYLFAWGLTAAAVSTITTPSGKGWYDGEPILGKKFKSTLVKPAAAPSGVIAFFVVSFMVFTSFGFHHLIIRASNGGYLCYKNAVKAPEYGYLALSAVAKTTLHLFLGLTVLSQADIGTEDRQPHRTVNSQQEVYGKGFGGAAGIVVGTAVVFFIVKRAFKGEPQSQGSSRAEMGLKWLPVSRVRWADYIVSAPIMYVVLSASWGLTSQPLLIIGAIAHAIAIACAAASDSNRNSADALKITELKVIHALCAIIHAASATALLVWARHVGALNAALPLDRRITTQSLAWFYVCSSATQSRGSPEEQDKSWQTYCEQNGDMHAMTIAMDSPPNKANFYIVPWAAAFALWSAAGHLYTFVVFAEAGRRRA